MNHTLLKSLLFLLAASGLVVWGCRPTPSEKQDTVLRETVDSLLSREQIADKVRGLLIGSAIGDAMGAPTEMWDRLSIRIEYGHIDTLDPAVREASPEGPWAYNLPAGGTTDDTRWKTLTADFLSSTPAGVDTLDARRFAQHIIDTYLDYIQALKSTDSFRPEPFEREARRMTWLQEWALVARPYVEGDYETYITALNRFYGGDLACAGLLYAPVIGLFYPGAPEIAYEEGYRLGIFDHGYARDITGLAAAMTAAAAAHDANPERCLAVIRHIDPHNFFESRLLGRSAYRIYREARNITYEARNLQPSHAALDSVRLPKRWKDSPLAFLQREKAYELLDPKLQDAPFHAGEIWLITLTGMMMHDWEFLPAMEFIINYGRDNDTTGALAGAILGAYHGASGLPPDLVETVLTTNRENLDIDLEKVAETLTEAIWRRHPGNLAVSRD
jgi:hypothetical protein